MRFDSAWVPGGERRVLRQGMGAADLWTGRVLWHEAPLERSFTVIVMDQQYLDEASDQRRGRPAFETFVIGMIQSDAPGVENVYEWRTAPERTWCRRGTWLTPLGDESDVQRRQSIRALGKECWLWLHDLNNLFAARGAVRASRRGRRGSAPRVWDCHIAQRAPRLDVILPVGLDKFVASCSKRPSSFEELCRSLWEMEYAGHDHASMPVWYRDTCPPSLV